MDQTEFVLKPCESAVSSHHGCLAAGRRSLDVGQPPPSLPSTGEAHDNTGCPPQPPNLLCINDASMIQKELINHYLTINGGTAVTVFLNSLCTNTQIQTTRASLLKESIKIFNLPVGINVLVGSHKERRPFASPPKDPIQNLPAVLTVAEAFGGGASRLRPQTPPNLGDVTWCRAPAERGGSGPRFSSGQRLPNISHHLFKSKWRRAASGGERRRRSRSLAAAAG